MRNKILLLPLLLLAVACNNNRQDAEAMLNRAEQYYRAGDCLAATQWIDSISVAYPDEVEIIRKGMMLQCHVNQKMYEVELVRIDSLYNIATAEVAALKSRFELVKEGKEQTVANYVYKGSRSGGVVSKSELRAHVTEKGDFLLTSVYFGGNKINHTGISVKHPNGGEATSKLMAYDGAKNYRYTSGGKAVEMVTYNLAQCSEVADAIAQTAGKVSVNYVGGKKHSITIDNNTRKAIADTYRLAVAMAQVDTLYSQREYSILQLELADRQLMKLQDQETQQEK